MAEKYRKKPVVIEAMRWMPGDLAAAGEMWGWLGVDNVDFVHTEGMGDTTNLVIKTLEGSMTADPGDWIIKGVKGEFYPCKPDIFKATYEAVTDDGIYDHDEGPLYPGTDFRVDD